jgi:hypothetical protein
MPSGLAMLEDVNGQPLSRAPSDTRGLVDRCRLQGRDLSWARALRYAPLSSGLEIVRQPAAPTEPIRSAAGQLHLHDVKQRDLSVVIPGLPQSPLF